MSLNWLRRRRVPLPQLSPEPAPLPSELIEHKELTLALREALQELPPQLTEIYRLRATGLVYQEISHIMEIPVGTVKSRMHTLVSRLKQELQSWNPS